MVDHGMKRIHNKTSELKLFFGSLKIRFQTCCQTSLHDLSVISLILQPRKQMKRCSSSLSSIPSKPYRIEICPVEKREQRLYARQLDSS